RQTVVALVLRRGDAQLLLDDLVAQLDALVADVHAGPGDELLDLLLALPAEGALQQVGAFLHTCHERPHFPGRLASAVSGRAWPPRRLPGATPGAAPLFRRARGGGNDAAGQSHSA